MNLLKIILYVFSVIVAIIIMSAFILSFTNLNAAAMEAGIPEPFSYLFPLNLDLILVASSLFILYCNLSNNKVYLGWIVLVAFTAVSTIFNIAHSPADILSRASHAVPPIALCVSMELLMLVLRYTIGHEPDEQPIEPIKKSEKGELIKQYFIDHPDSTVDDCHEHFGFSKTTINKYKV